MLMHKRAAAPTNTHTHQPSNLALSLNLIVRMKRNAAERASGFAGGI